MPQSSVYIDCSLTTTEHEKNAKADIPPVDNMRLFTRNITNRRSSLPSQQQQGNRFQPQPQPQPQSQLQPSSAALSQMHARTRRLDAWEQQQREAHHGSQADDNQRPPGIRRAGPVVKRGEGPGPGIGSGPGFKPIQARRMASMSAGLVPGPSLNFKR